MLCVMVTGNEPTKPAHASLGNENATEMIIQVAGTNNKIWHMRNGQIRPCAIFAPLFWLDHFVSCGKWDMKLSDLTSHKDNACIYQPMDLPDLKNSLSSFGQM